MTTVQPLVVKWRSAGGLQNWLKDREFFSLVSTKQAKKKKKKERKTCAQ